MNSDDAELLRRYASEHAEDAFAELVRRHVDLVYHAALRQVGGDAHRAEDVTQAVFTALARKAASLGRHEALAGWLHTATRFIAGRVMRTERRRAAREQEAWAMNELTQDEMQAAHWERLRPVIDDVLGELNTPDRDAVLLRFFAAQPLAEIGARLGLSENAARMRVERALEKLRLRLARRGVTSTTTALGLALANHATAAAPVGLASEVASSALAGVATGAGDAAFTAAKIMSTMKIGGGVAAALLLVAALSTAFVAVRAQAGAERALAEDQGRFAVMNARVRELDREATALEAAREARSKRGAEPVAKTPAATQGDPAKAAAAPTVADARAAGDAFMAKHPEVKEALGDYARARIRFRFSELYRRLGLTAEQIARFETLLATAGMGVDDPDGHYMLLSHRNVAARGETDRQLEELLGAEGLRLYREMSRKEEAQRLAVHLAGSLWSSEVPLTPAQADQLVGVFLATKTKPSPRSNVGIDWDAAVAQAGTFLSAPQLAALEAERASDEQEGVTFRKEATK